MAIPIKKWAKEHDVDEDLARRIAGAVKASKKAGDYYGDMADAIDRTIGRKISAYELPLLTEIMRQESFNPPAGYKPLGKPAERPAIDEKKNRVAQGQSDAAARGGGRQVGRRRGRVRRGGAEGHRGNGEAPREARSRAAVLDSDDVRDRLNPIR